MSLVLCTTSSNGKTKGLFTPWKLGSIKKYKYWLTPFFDTFAWYLFQLIAPLKPDFYCLSSFTLSWVSTVTTGIKSFVPGIENVAPWFATLVATIKHFWDQFKSRAISQSIKDISKVLRKLLSYFNGTIIFPFFVPLSPVLPDNFNLRLNESVRLASVKSANLMIFLLIFAAGSSLQYYHKIPNAFGQLSLYSIKLYKSIQDSWFLVKTIINNIVMYKYYVSDF